MAEYLSRAMALAQDAAKLSLRFSEEIVDNALEFGLDTPGSFYNNAEYNLASVRKALNSGADKEKVVAMKRLLVIVAKGVDASEYFADVVKNVASGSLEVRRLVYIYLLRYAEQEQDLALLSINTFQRDLADANQVIRAMALRVMTSIRVPVISSIAVMAVRKLATDRSPHVRKTAALAVPKLLRLDAALKSELVDVVADMLGEASPLAIGSVIRAFTAVCPTHYDLVHQNYRRWCLMVGDLDEWGQVELVKLLTAYARTHFAGPPSDSPESSLDADHALLLRSIHPLLQSRNSAVVMSVVSAYYHLAPAQQLDAVARPLVRLMKSSREAACVALTNIQQIALRRPEIFASHVRSFYVAALDPPFIRALKLRVLAAVACAATAPVLVAEVAGYTQSAQEDVGVGAVAVLLACAQRTRASTMDCFRGLVALVDDTRAPVVDAAVRAIRILLLDGSVRDSQDRTAVTLYDILCHLVRHLDTCKAADARAHIFSLVAEFATSRFGCLHALDVLRGAARLFRDEADGTKMQILELSARLVLLLRNADAGKGSPDQGTSPPLPVGGDIAQRLVQHAGVLNDLHAYLFTMARYDVSFEVRDRARLLRALCPLGGDEAHVDIMPSVVAIADELIGYGSKQILDSEAGARIRREIAAQPRFTIGSMSLATGRVVAGYLPLPDWPTTHATVDRGTATPAAAAASEVLAPGGARAITIAGISGRAQPQYADFSTPRNGDTDDLDAFLNSEDAARTGPEFVHAPVRIAMNRMTASVPGRTRELSSSSSDSSFSDTSSGSELEDGDVNDGGNSSSGLEPDDDESSASHSGSESESESDDERNPFVHSTSPAAHPVLEDPFAGARSSNHHHHNTSTTAKGHESDDDTHPLIEGTSVHWQ